MALEIRPARGRAARERFLCFPYRLYAGDPLWVPPIMPDRRARIDPRRGEIFRSGEAEFFMAYRDGKLAGTISAAWNRADCELRGVREAEFGFFEYDCAETAKGLVHAARSWAEARGLDSMVGPFNLDPEDGYGVLLEGRDRPPALLCGHSMPYYAETMEALGFQPARPDNIALELRLDPAPPELERLMGMEESIRRRGRFSIRTVDFSDMEGEITRVHALLNLCLAHLKDFRPSRRETVEEMVAPFARFADPELILFAEKDGKTIGWLPGIQNLNESLGRLGGLRWPWQYLGLPCALKRRTACVSVKSVLVDPEWWGRGLGPCMIAELYRRMKAKGYSWVDMSLTSVDNPYAPQLAMRLGARIYKRYRVYRMDFS